MHITDNCSFELLKDHELPERTNLKVVSTSLFRVVNRKFIDLDRYAKGVVTLCDTYARLRPDWVIRLYVDNSLFVLPGAGKSKEHKYYHFETSHFNRLFNKKGGLKDYPNLQIWRVTCGEHMNLEDSKCTIKEFDGSRKRLDSCHHRGLFSSMLRFYAGFDDDVTVAVFRDVDFTENSITNDLPNIDAWLETDDKYMFYIKFGYTPQHADEKESYFAGAWGVREGLPSSLEHKLHDIVNYPEYFSYRTVNDLLKKLDGKLDSLVDQKFFQETNEDSDWTHKCTGCLRKLESMSTKGRLTPKSKRGALKIRELIDMAVAETDPVLKREYIRLSLDLINCMETRFYKEKDIIEMLDLTAEVTEKIYTYGIDEIALNHVLKRDLFDIDRDDNALDIPLSMIYFIQNNRDGYFDFDDYYNYFYENESNTYITFGEPQYESMKRTYLKYRKRIASQSIHMIATLFPPSVLKALLHGSCKGLGRAARVRSISKIIHKKRSPAKADLIKLKNSLGNSCFNFFKDVVNQANLEMGTKYKLKDDVLNKFSVGNPDDKPNKRERFIYLVMEKLYMLEPHSIYQNIVVDHINRILEFYHIESLDIYHNRLIRNILV